MKARAIVKEVAFWGLIVLIAFTVIAVARWVRLERACPVCPEVRECTLPEVIDLGRIDAFDFQGYLIRRKTDGDEEEG